MTVTKEYIDKLKILADEEEQLFGKKNAYDLNRYVYQQMLCTWEKKQRIEQQILPFFADEFNSQGMDLDQCTTENSENLCNFPDGVLGPGFFCRYSLNRCLEEAGIFKKYDGTWNEPESELLANLLAIEKRDTRKYRLLAKKEEDLFPIDANGQESLTTINRQRYNAQLEYLNTIRIMQEILSIWDTEDDFGFTDEWYADRVHEYMEALYSMPTDEIADLMPQIDLHGKKLAYKDNLYYQGLCLRKDEDLEEIYKSGLSQLDLKCLTPEDMSVPFEAHSIWDALLLLLSAQWIGKPEMFMTYPINEDKKQFVPRVTIHGDKAVATFCSVRAFLHLEEEVCPLNKNAILVQRKGDSFEILGGCCVDYGYAHNFRNFPQKLDTMPPIHRFTDEEIRRIESARISRKENLDEQKGEDAYDEDDLPF